MFWHRKLHLKMNEQHSVYVATMNSNILDVKLYMCIYKNIYFSGYSPLRCCTDPQPLMSVPSSSQPSTAQRVAPSLPIKTSTWILLFKDKSYLTAADFQSNTKLTVVSPQKHLCLWGPGWAGLIDPELLFVAANSSSAASSSSFILSDILQQKHFREK